MGNRQLQLPSSIVEVGMVVKVTFTALGVVYDIVAIVNFGF